MSKAVQSKSIEKQVAAFKNSKIKNTNTKTFHPLKESNSSFGKRLEFSTFLYAIFAGIIAICFYTNGAGDFDLLWHTKLGEYIGTTFTIPTTDIFSWIGKEKELPFTAHSWFFSLTAYNITLFTQNIMSTGKIIVFLGAFLLFFTIKICLLPKRHTLFLIFALLSGIVCSNPRPQAFSFTYLFLALFIMKKCSENKKSKIWLLMPILSLLWANIHGGTILILFCFEVMYMFLWFLPNMKIGPFLNENDGGFDGKQLLLKNNKNKDELIKNWKLYADTTFKNFWLKGVLIIVSSFATACLNPYGLKIFTYGFIENNSVTKMFVSEWQPIQLKNSFLLGVLIVTIVYFFLHYKDEVKLSVILPTLCCVGVCAIYSRFVLYGVVTSMFISAEILNHFITKKWNNVSWNLFSITIVVLFSLIASSIKSTEMESLRMDTETSSYLQEQQFKRPFTCHDDGGRLIYEGIPTFIDQRFTDPLMKDAILAESMMLEGKTIEEYIKEYNFDAFVFHKKSNEPLEDYLRLLEEWKVGFENESYVVFVPQEKTQ